MWRVEGKVARLGTCSLRLFRKCLQPEQPSSQSGPLWVSLVDSVELISTGKLLSLFNYFSQRFKEKIVIRCTGQTFIYNECKNCTEWDNLFEEQLNSRRDWLRELLSSFDIESDDFFSSIEWNICHYISIRAEAEHSSSEPDREKWLCMGNGVPSWNKARPGRRGDEAGRRRSSPIGTFFLDVAKQTSQTAEI